MRYPEFIKKNDTIGFPAPSFSPVISPYKELFASACEMLGRRGYKTLPGKASAWSHGVGICGTPRECAEDLMEMYLSPDCDALISCSGGELMCETIPYMDYEKLKNAGPKWFMGYSDNTNFVLPLVTLCDTAAIYGSCAATFGQQPLDPSLEDALELLEGKKLTMHNYKMWGSEYEERESNPLAAYKLTNPSCVKAYTPSEKALELLKLSGSEKGNLEAASCCGFEETSETSFSGRILGGCLDCLVSLCGTKFDRVKEFTERYKEDRIIWFLESCDLNLMQMRRAVWQLKNSGWFSNVSGIIVGRPLQFELEEFGITRKEAYLANLRELNVPVILDADLGHIPPQMPLIVGSLGHVNYNSGNLSIEMELK